MTSKEIAPEALHQLFDSQSIQQTLPSQMESDTPFNLKQNDTIFQLNYHSLKQNINRSMQQQTSFSNAMKALQHKNKLQEDQIHHMKGQMD